MAGVRMRTVAAISLLIHLLALSIAGGLSGIIESGKKKNYISVEFIQNTRGFNQANTRAIRRPDTIAPPVDKSAKAPEDTMSMTPHVNPLVAAPQPEAGSNETGPASNAKAGYLGIHRVSKLPFFLTQVKPVYPFSERAAGVEARVIAEVYINEYGGVDDVKIIKSAGSVFDEAVVKAVKDSSFSPGYLEGRPVAVKVQIPFMFKLR